MPRTLAVIYVLFLMICCGCGKYNTNPVSGRVTLADGAPVDGVRVTFERIDPQPAISAMAVTDKDGRYSLGTIKAGDGAPAGKYRVMISEILSPEESRPPRINKNYWRYDSSALQFEVTGGDNTFDLQLDPYR